MDTFVGQVRDLGKEHSEESCAAEQTESPHFLNRIPNFPSLVPTKFLTKFFARVGLTEK